MVRRWSVATLVAVLALAGCGESPFEPEPEDDLGLWASVTFEYNGVHSGSFKVEKTWDGSTDVLPYAVAAPVSYEGVDEVVRFLTTDVEQVSLSITIFHLPLPGEARMVNRFDREACDEANPCARSYFIAGVSEAGNPRIFVMTEGTVTVEERADGRIKGRFSFLGVSLAQDAVGDDHPSAFLEGSFDLPVTLLGCNDSACDRGGNGGG
jgi:hypothetical protein